MLIQLLERFPVWAKPLLSCFIIGTTETAQQVNDKIRAVLDDNDLFIVIKVAQPHQGWLDKDIHKWIEDNVPYCS